MKRILIALAMLWSAHAGAQTCAAWTSAGAVLTAANAPASSTFSVTVSFTSPIAIAGAILNTEIHDPSGNKVIQSWQQPGVDFSICQTIAGAPLTWQIPANAPLGTYTIQAGTYSADQTNLYWNQAVATFTVTAPTAARAVPICTPISSVKAVGGLVPDGVTARQMPYWGVWVCAAPAGYQTNGYIGSLLDDAVNIVKYQLGNYTQAQALADCAATCATPNASEAAFLNPLMQANRPKALVAFNGANTTRSVFTINANGTLNPVPVTGESIAVASRCDETKRISPAQPTSQTYYSVAGQNDPRGNPLPQGTYALCTVSLPIGAN